MRTYMTLDSAHSLRGQVIDPSGKPIPGARVVAFWSGPEGYRASSFGVASRRTLNADYEGRFEWKEAPGKGVSRRHLGRRVRRHERLGLASDVDNRIVLIAADHRQGDGPRPRDGPAVPRVLDPAGRRLEAWGTVHLAIAVELGSGGQEGRWLV